MSIHHSNHTTEREASQDSQLAFPDGFKCRELPAGYLLADPQQSQDFVFMVNRGRLRVYLAGECRSLTLSFLEPGDIYSTHTPTYVESVEPTTIWLMDTATFAQKLSTDPTTSPKIMRVLGRLLSNAVELVEDLAFREVPARLARFFIGLAERRGKPTEQGIIVQVDLSTEEIASLLGSTRQTVSTLINQWEREEILQRQGRRNLIIRSMESLKEHLNNTSNVG